MTFSTSLKVRFGDVDRAGITYYPSLLHYCHVAMEEYFETELQLGLPELFDRLETGIPIVHVEADFKKPLQFGEKLTVRVAVQEIRHRSFTLQFTILKHPNEVCAHASVTHVAVDLPTFQPCPIPALLLERLEASSQRSSSANHKG